MKLSKTAEPCSYFQSKFIFLLVFKPYACRLMTHFAVSGDQLIPGLLCTVAQPAQNKLDYSFSLCHTKVTLAVCTPLLLPLPFLRGLGLALGVRP